MLSLDLHGGLPSRAQGVLNGNPAPHVVGVLLRVILLPLVS